MGRPTLGDHPESPGSDPHWVKSSRSYANGNCVEVARLPRGQVLVRDSKQPDGPVLRFTPGQWQAFVAAVRNGVSGRSGHNTAAAGNPP